MSRERVRSRVATAIAAACITLLVPATADAETTVASCTAPASGGYAVQDGFQELAQSFTVADDVTVNAINLHLGDLSGGAGDFIVRVVPLTESGLPSSTVLAQGTVPRSSTPTVAGDRVVRVNFVAPANLKGGQQYAFTISASGPGEGSASGSTSNPCPGGNAFFRTSSSDTWKVDAALDYWFELLGAPTDSDGDGTPDAKDVCPALAGPAANNGCPLIDSDPPETVITKEPKNRSSKSTAKYKFVSDEPGSTFECKIDKKPFKPCASPKKFKVKDGKHKFLVRAIDAAGNVDLSADKDKFKVVD